MKFVANIFFFHFLLGCVGLVCPCFLFGKNAEFLGSGTATGSCMTHLILWSLVNTVFCLLTEGILLGLPGCFIACYACGYRRELRTRYNLQVCHFFPFSVNASVRSKRYLSLRVLPSLCICKVLCFYSLVYCCMVQQKLHVIFSG